LSVAVAVVLIVTAAVSIYRWTWVSQKEHYLAPAVSVAALRWIRAYLLNAGVAAVAAAGAVASLGLAAAGTEAAGPFALGSMVLAAAFPLGMDPRAVRLRFTRRASFQTGVTCILVAAIAAAARFGAGRIGAVAIAVVLVPLVVDASAALLRPVEARLAGRFVKEASVKLQRVGPRVVAITGSWGKTSTKNHLADLAGAFYQTVASPASWNNTPGVARTINEKLVTGTDLLILEMGTYGPGEIRQMCSWTRPEIAVICEIGPMHLERMKTVDTIVRAKAEITESADQVVLWVDNPHLDALANELGSGHKLWRVGRAGRAGLDVSVREGDGDGIEFFWGETLVGSAPLQGRVQPGNVACAVAASLALGLSPTRVGSRLANLSAPPHRAVASRSERGVWVIDDTYNSNPAGAASALERLLQLNPDGRRVVITPGMVELGSLQSAANRDFAAAVAAGGAELLVVGRTNHKDLLAGFGQVRRSGTEPGAITVADREAARSWVAANLQSGDAVLWENDLPPHYP